MIIGLLSILAVLFAIPAPPVGAERVWDGDLKRYLTDQEMNMATVYLQEEEGIKIMFPKSERVRKDVLTLNREKKIPH